jgi:hypothetical protein
MVGGRSGMDVLDNHLWEIDLSTGVALRITDEQFVTPIRPLPVKGACAGSPQAYSPSFRPESWSGVREGQRTTAETLKKHGNGPNPTNYNTNRIAAMNEKVSNMSLDGGMNVMNGVNLGIVQTERSPTEGEKGPENTDISNRSDGERERSDGEQSRSDAVTEERNLRSSEKKTSTKESNSRRETAKEENEETLEWKAENRVWRTLMFMEGGRKGNDYSAQFLKLEKSNDRKFRWIDLVRDAFCTPDFDYSVKDVNDYEAESLEREAHERAEKAIQEKGAENLRRDSGIAFRRRVVPPPRNHHACDFVHNLPDKNGEFWIFGGRSNHRGNDMGLRHDLWRYTVTTGIWTDVTPKDLQDQGESEGVLVADSGVDTKKFRDFCVRDKSGETEEEKNGNQHIMAWDYEMVNVARRNVDNGGTEGGSNEGNSNDSNGNSGNAAAVTNGAANPPANNSAGSTTSSTTTSNSETPSTSDASKSRFTRRTSSTVTTPSNTSSPTTTPTKPITIVKPNATTMKPEFQHSSTSTVWPSGRFLPTLEHFRPLDKMIIFAGQSNLGRLNDMWHLDRATGNMVQVQKCWYCKENGAEGVAP